LENRARLLLGIVEAVRAAVSPSFAVAVKLNSADFQLGVDLVELSGGSYEPSHVGTAGRRAHPVARGVLPGPGNGTCCDESSAV
jgi:2,4-dienoyl-CoA reductase-like NADH-dependent reductase (Old Yellow Enzyme family)